MNSKQIAFFTILALIIIVPTVNAQIPIDTESVQKSVKITIISSDKIHARHVIAPLDSPKQIELIEGNISNLLVSDNNGEEKQFGVISNNDSVIIYPSKEDTIIEYDLTNVLFLKDNVWRWDFRYLETTDFIVPKEADLIFVNERPVYLGEKNGISCHGCQMILEYSINEPKILKNVKYENKDFLIEIRTFAEINQLNFDQSTKKISFQVKGENQFVTAIIPLKILPDTYNVLMEDKKISFHEFNNNGTHVWLNIRSLNSGIVSIIDPTTIDDEKPIQNNDLASVFNANNDVIIYFLIGLIISIVLVLIVIMRKKKSFQTSKTLDKNNV